jgi:signal transduction histidine kinase
LIDNNSALIHISDNGVGIKATIKESMFLPHFTTKNSGSGIGLAMSKRIIEYWNGSIWFDSIENLGTDFYVKLPILEQTIA